MTARLPQAGKYAFSIRTIEEAHDIASTRLNPVAPGRGDDIAAVKVNAPQNRSRIYSAITTIPDDANEWQKKLYIGFQKRIDEHGWTFKDIEAKSWIVVDEVIKLHERGMEKIGRKTVFESDRNITCSARVNCVVQILQYNKLICADVMDTQFSLVEFVKNPNASLQAKNDRKQKSIKAVEKKRDARCTGEANTPNASAVEDDIHGDANESSVFEQQEWENWAAGLDPSQPSFFDDSTIDPSIFNLPQYKMPQNLQKPLFPSIGLDEASLTSFDQPLNTMPQQQQQPARSSFIQDEFSPNPFDPLIPTPLPGSSYKFPPGSGTRKRTASASLRHGSGFEDELGSPANTFGQRRQATGQVTEEESEDGSEDEGIVWAENLTPATYARKARLQSQKGRQDNIQKL